MLRSHTLIIYHDKQIHIAGAKLFKHFAGWREPIDQEFHQQALPLGAKVANLGSTDIIRVCGHCEAPLWGTVYAATHRLITPYHMAICRWCCGCLNPTARAKFVKIDSGLAREDVFRNSALWGNRFYKNIFHTRMLKAPAELVTDRETGDVYVVLDSLILETPGTFSKIPPCLRVFPLKDIRRWKQLSS